MSEVLDPPVDHRVAAALDALNAALDALADTDPWMLTDSELLESLAGVHRLSCRADAVLHALVREADARGARSPGWSSTAAARLEMVTFGELARTIDPEGGHGWRLTEFADGSRSRVNGVHPGTS